MATLYEVALEQKFAGQQCINRWNYVGSGVPAAVSGSFALLQALGFIGINIVLPTTTVGRALQQLQNPGAAFIQATARAVYVDEDFYGNPFLANTTGATGEIGTGLSPLDAFGFRSNRVLQSVRRGYKRFVGVDEAQVGGQGNIVSITIDMMNALATAMSAALTYDDEGNTLTFTPAIASKVKYTTPSGKTAYKYYATEAEQAAHTAIGIAWSPYPQTRSQVSRQYGRGS